MIVSSAELKTDLDRYLELVGEEEIVITKNGRNVAALTLPAVSKAAIIRSLRGTLPPTATLEEAHEERIAKYENSL
jgi:antitoxin (DNA-binding transcriptional repressor) of toxin-antitoxin stability system